MADTRIYRPAAERGLALITAVLIVAIVSTLGAFVALNQQLWLRQMENISDRERVEMLDRGAIEWAIITLADDVKNSPDTDNLGEDWARKVRLPVEGGSIEIRGEDAQGRLNLNNLWSGNAPNGPYVGVLRQLLTSLKLNPELSEPLVDWLDPDTQTRASGAEDIEYLNLDPPYRAANQPLASVDELRLVRGYTAEVVEALRPYVTVIPVPTVININTVSPPLLTALVPGLTLSQAEQALAERAREPFKNAQALQSRLPQGLTLPAGIVGVKSGYFLVMLDTSIGRYRRLSEAMLERPTDGKPSQLLWQRPQPIVLKRDDKETEE
jgi:general secretion pathway protein K